MKASSFTVALGASVAILALTGCGNNEGLQSQSQSQSQSTPSQLGSWVPMRGEDTASGFVHPTGQKQGGQYYWIWVSAWVGPSTNHFFIANCPKKYVVTGGGFAYDKGPGPVTIGASQPRLPGLNGWIVVAQNNGSSRVAVVDFAVCAPTT
jgi:hypothetical protein